MTAQNFIDKDFKKKAWTLAMMYFKKCTTNGAFHNGKPSSEFFKVRSFFMQIDENSMLKQKCRLPMCLLQQTNSMHNSSPRRIRIRLFVNDKPLT